MHPLVCVDPVDPANNTAKSCYRVAAVQRLFASAARTATEQAEKMAELVERESAEAEGTTCGEEGLIDAILGVARASP